MKTIPYFVALLVVLVCSTANAASLHVNTTNSLQTNAIYLDGGPQNGLFNTVIFEAVPISPPMFINLSSGVGKPAGDANTYRNRALDADPLDGGLGWSLVGAQTTATSLTFTGGPLGSNITTADQPGGRLFLANLHFAPPYGFFNARVQLLDGTGTRVADLWILAPEPTSAILSVMSPFGLVVSRRRVNKQA